MQQKFLYKSGTSTKILEKDDSTPHTEATNVPDIVANSVYLMDNKTNAVLYSKNENEKVYPASTTKILTAIIVLENCNLDDIVTANYSAIMNIPEGYTTANIQIGEQLNVEQLLELLLVYSANDAANVLAEHVGGSIDSFVSMMNTRLNELSLTNTHFTNPYGLHDENHYATAHDLAYLMKYCLKNDTFRKIAGKASCAIPATNLHEPRLYSSTNELLVPDNANYYKYLVAGKTGFTSQAKGCLVSSAYRDDLEFIGVVLGSDSRFVDTRNLYQYGYSNYSVQKVVNKDAIVTNLQISNASYTSKDLDLLANEEISALMNNQENSLSLKPKITLKENISAPIDEGAILGKATYEINGVEYSTNLVASHSVEPSKFLVYSIYTIIGGNLLVLLVFGVIWFIKKKIILKK